MTLAIYVYGAREADILAARFRGLLTDTEFVQVRALAYLEFGYMEAARRWWGRA